MKKNTSLIVTLAMVALIGMTSSAMAGHGQGKNYRGDCMASGNHGPRIGYSRAQLDQLTPEKKAAYVKIMEASRARVEPLRENMWEKRLELKALSPNPNTQPADIKALVKEIGALHVQMKHERDALKTQLETEIGLKVGNGMGMRGHGMRGQQHKGMNKGMKNMMRGNGMMDCTGPNCTNAQ